MTASRWIRLERTTPSGKQLFLCRTCGRESPTPDKRCADGCRDETRQRLQVDRATISDGEGTVEVHRSSSVRCELDRIGNDLLEAIATALGVTFVCDELDAPKLALTVGGRSETLERFLQPHLDALLERMGTSTAAVLARDNWTIEIR